MTRDRSDETAPDGADDDGCTAEGAADSDSGVDAAAVVRRYYRGEASDRDLRRAIQAVLDRPVVGVHPDGVTVTVVVERPGSTAAEQPSTAVPAAPRACYSVQPVPTLDGEVVLDCTYLGPVM